MAARQALSPHAERAGVLDNLRGARSPRVSRVGTRGKPRAVRGTSDEKDCGMGEPVAGLGYSGQITLAGQARLISPLCRAAPPPPGQSHQVSDRILSKYAWSHPARFCFAAMPPWAEGS